MKNLKFIKTVDNDRMLRIEDGDGAAITIFKDRTYGHILSVIVPEESREQGIGRTLIAAAERELALSGIHWIDADFYRSDDPFSAFFEKTGFSVSVGADVLSISMKDLMESSIVKKLMEAKPANADFIPLSGISFEQWDEVIDLLKKQHVYIGNGDMARLDQDISCVVYDGKKILQAVLFCSVSKGDLNVDLLMGFGKDGQKYIMAALQGMLYGIESCGGAETFQKLTAIAVNKKVPALMEKALSNGIKPQKNGEIVYAKKMIRDVSEGAEQVTEKPDDDKNTAWWREIRKIPMQANISYKLPWSRSAPESGEKGDREP